MIKKNIIFYVLVFVLGGFILIYQILPEIIPEANADDVVGVSASVSTSVTCASDPATSTFPTLTTTAVATSTPNATTTLSCNYAAGCTLRIYDEGTGVNPALASSTQKTTIYIGSANNSFGDTNTLVAGTEGYGIKGATTSAGTGQELRMQNPRYNQYNLGVGNYAVGGLERTGSQQQIASSTIPISGRELIVTHLAAIDGLTEAGTYEDQNFYTCLGN
jgi:hypothetical protein